MKICYKKHKCLRTGLHNSILSRTKGLELHRNVQFGSYNLFVGPKTLSKEFSVLQCRTDQYIPTAAVGGVLPDSSTKSPEMLSSRPTAK